MYALITVTQNNKENEVHRIHGDVLETISTKGRVNRSVFVCEIYADIGTVFRRVGFSRMHEPVGDSHPYTLPQWVWNIFVHVRGNRLLVIRRPNDSEPTRLALHQDRGAVCKCHVLGTGHYSPSHDNSKLHWQSNITSSEIFGRCRYTKSCHRMHTCFFSLGSQHQGEMWPNWFTHSKTH